MEFFGIQHFGTFIAAAVMLNLTPGTDTMYILGRSMAHGSKAGVLSALGISTGAMFHTLAAASGLSLLLATSATAFSLIKYCGALYLIYLGIRSFFPTEKSGSNENQQNSKTNYRQIYISGIISNILNPKVALFFLAFLPQFIDPVYPHTILSFILLGSTFVFTGTCWCLLLAFYAAKFSNLLQERGTTGNMLNRLSGVVFIGLGLKLACMER
jgi:threonine/homoserine/homoserine lactone efflux protein